MENMILAINTGSTSTKLALFSDTKLIVKQELFIDSEAISEFEAVAQQLPLRRSMVKSFMDHNGINPDDLDMIVARGGSLPPIEGGAYKVNEAMINELINRPKAQHASNLACMIGHDIGKPLGVPVIIYDAPGTDEFDPVAKITGLPEVTIIPVSHVLNTRKVARDTAAQIGKAYEGSRFIVAHLGGGISINAHRNGKIVDSVYDDMGPMSPQRAGRIPTRFMTALCYSGKYTEAQMRKKLAGEGGLTAYFGTQDLRKIAEMMNTGNKQAGEILFAMAYQIAKAIGEMATVLSGQVDRIILTGGCAHDKMITDWIEERVRFIAPVVIMPGEREMEALAEGGLRVLNGVEQAKEYTRT